MRCVLGCQLIMLLALAAAVLATDRVLIYRSGSENIKVAGENILEWKTTEKSNGVFAVQYYKEETTKVNLLEEKIFGHQ